MFIKGDGVLKRSIFLGPPNGGGKSLVPKGLERGLGRRGGRGDLATKKGKARIDSGYNGILE